MAFWKYDLYPYLLHGEINEKIMPLLSKNRLCYYIDSYQGYYCPEFIVPIKEGRILGNLIDELKNKERLAQKRLREEYVDHLHRILKENEVDYKVK